MEQLIKKNKIQTAVSHPYSPRAPIQSLQSLEPKFKNLEPNKFTSNPRINQSRINLNKDQSRPEVIDKTISKTYTFNKASLTLRFDQEILKINIKMF